MNAIGVWHAMNPLEKLGFFTGIALITTGFIAPHFDVNTKCLWILLGSRQVHTTVKQLYGRVDQNLDLRIAQIQGIALAISATALLRYVCSWHFPPRLAGRVRTIQRSAPI